MERTRTALPQLTDRQREVLRLVARGHTNTEIAEMLGISLAGAKWHVSELLARFDVETREELAERWESVRNSSPRLRRWGITAASMVSTRAAASVAAGATVFGASAITIGVLARQESEPAESPAEPTATEAATPVPPLELRGAPLADPPDAIWTWREAEAHARPATVTIQHTRFDTDPLAQLTLIDARWLPGIVHQDSTGSDNSDFYWKSVDGSPQNVWLFRWRASGLSGTDPSLPPFSGATLEVEVLIEDGVLSREPLAQRMFATTGSHGLGGSAQNFRSRHLDELQRRLQTPLGDPIRVAWLNGKPGGAYLEAQLMEAGWCTRASDGNGGGCYRLDGGQVIQTPISGVSSAPGAPRDVSLVVIAQPFVTVIELRFPDGRVRKHATDGNPAVPGRFAYLSLGVISEPVEVIAYDGLGAEVARKSVGLPAP